MVGQRIARLIWVFVLFLLLEFPPLGSSEIPDVPSSCVREFLNARFLTSKSVEAICSEVQEDSDCKSVDQRSIFHYEKPGLNPRGKRILVFGQIHGDEPEAGELALLWIERTIRLKPQNSWRIIPRLNPDGGVARTRTNQNGVDLNQISRPKTGRFSR